MLQVVIQQIASFLLGEVGAPGATDFRFDVVNRARNISAIPSLADKHIKTPAPRKGCVIGLKKPTSLPSVTKVLSLPELGAHKYTDSLSFYQASDDTIGHVYTQYGGIIDIAHLRDHADLTRYIAAKLIDIFPGGGEIDLGDDTDPFRDNTGKRVIKIKAQGKQPSAFQAALLGAVIAYDVAIWHEIATYKTWQDYSTFSPEDNYSNLLGCYVGFLACLNDTLSYEDAVTSIMFRKLNRLKPVAKNVSEAIINYLEGRWYEYTEGVRFYDVPGPLNLSVYLKLKRRHFISGLNESLADRIRPGFYVSPWLITDASRLLPSEIRNAVVPHPPSFQKTGVHIPQVDENNSSLRQFYNFEIRNAANKDPSLFDTLLDANGALDASKFGRVTENIRTKYRYEMGLNADSPAGI